jgi:hypothetical protein
MSWQLSFVIVLSLVLGPATYLLRARLCPLFTSTAFFYSSCNIGYIELLKCTSSLLPLQKYSAKVSLMFSPFRTGWSYHGGKFTLAACLEDMNYRLQSYAKSLLHNEAV